jgi:hypothetical protein
MEANAQLDDLNQLEKTFTTNLYQGNRVLIEYLDARLDFSPEYQERIKIADILANLDQGRVVLQGSFHAQAMRISRLLVQKGAWKVQTHEGARWNGLRWKQ